MKRILAIDDHELVHNLICDILMPRGFDVIGAQNGLFGVKLAQKYVPDLIICDITMPKLDGYGVLDELRKDETTATIPFIFLSANRSRTDIRHGMGLGADDYLTKPFAPLELIDAVNTRLEKREVVVKHSEKKLDDLRRNVTYALPHEFRTPLMLVQGYSKLLLDDRDKIAPEHVEMLEQIDSSGSKLHVLIEKFWVYTNIELIASDPHKVKMIRDNSVEDAALIIKTLAVAEAEAMGRNEDLVLDVDDAALQIAKEDLTTILQEILNNAFKFSDAGTAVRVSTKHDKNYLVVHITDYGRGMKPDQIATVGAYMQFDRDLYEQPGIGLGLISAKRLAELYGGQLAIQSAVDGKTTVTVRHPRFMQAA